MATTVDELQVLITADVARLKQGLNVVQKQLASLKGSTGTTGKSMSASMVAAGTIIGNIATRVISAGFSAISSSVDGAISRLDTLNNYERVMSNLGIGASDAQKSIQVLQEALLGLPTTLDDASLSVQRLVSANGNIAASTDMFLAFNNALLAGGAGADIQRAALEQMMQAYAKGKPEAEEWRSLMTAMPAQLKQIATALGYTSTAIGGDLYNDIQTGKLSMDDFMLTIVKLNKEGVGSFESFETQARNSTGGVATSITNLKTAITRGITDVMNVIGQSNIAGFFNNIASVIGNVATYVAAFVKIIKEAVAWIGALFGGSGSTENLVKETGGAADNMESVSSGAASAAGSLNDAGSAAKKLKSQLAGFDEMNVLTESSSGSSGGSGGSGGGGSAGSNLGDYNWDSSGLTDGAEKVEAAVKKIKDALKGIFGDLNLDKIGNALKQFSKDVSKFMKLVKKILGEVWEDYLQPFLEWSGNSLLPAVLNAIGGAINLLGGIISSLWDNWLKPFIDSFLVPIAEFTGGIIISVLNGIGNALRAIGENQAAVNAIVASLVTLASLVAAAKITTVVNSLIATIPTLVAGVTNAITVFQSAYSAGMTLNSALGAMATASTGGMSAIAGLGQGLLGLVETVCSPVGIAILGVVAAITAIVTVVEFFKLKQAEAELSTQTYITSEQLAQQTANNRAAAVEREVAAMTALDSAINNVNNANLNLINAEENLRTSTDSLKEAAALNNMTTEEAIAWYEGLGGNMSQLDDQHLELAKAVGMYKDAQARSTEAAKEYQSAIEGQTFAEGQLYDAQQRELRALIAEQAQVYANTGDWEGMANMLANLAEQEYEFVDAQGNLCRRSKDEMAWLVSGVADDMGQAYEEWDKVWQNFPTSVRNGSADIAAALRDTGSTVKSNTTAVGSDAGQGLVNGLNSKSTSVWNAGYALGQQAVAGMRAGVDAHSPSKEALRVGDFIGQGLILGIKSEESPVRRAAEKLSASVTDSLSCLTGLSIDIPSVEDINGKVTSNIVSEVSMEGPSESDEPIHLTINIGEDRLLDKVVTGINRLSSLHNRAVIQV